MNLTRRNLLLASLGAISSQAFAAGAPTPRQTAGPFYPTELPLDDDADLTRVNGQAKVAKGDISDIRGRLLDTKGNPVRDARIEIWQCDANGRYLHPGDRANRPRDPGFQGHGATSTDKDGNYRFRTIRPVPYPGRTPHIHVAVFTWAEEPFVTQMYVAGESGNEDDFLFNRIPERLRHRVLAEFKASQQTGLRYEAQFDLVLAGVDGTPRA